MRQHVVAVHAIIGAPDGPGKTGAGGGERRKSQMLQKPRTADVPGIGKHKTALGMQGTKPGSFGGDIRHGQTMARASSPANRSLRIPAQEPADILTIFISSRIAA